MDLKVKISTDNRITESVDVDLRVFDMEAVKCACYKLSDVGQASIQLKPNNENQAVVNFSLPGEYSNVEVKNFLDEFNVELIDYDLRIKIRAETEVARNLILAYAFADSKLIEE